MVFPPRADLLIRTKDGAPLAIVELKNRKQLSEELAATIRRNLLTHGFPVTPFFVLLSQDKGFLWQPSDLADFSRKPDIAFSMTGIVNRFAHFGPSERLLENQLEVIVSEWLGHLVAESKPPRDEAERKLKEAGFLDAIAGGSVVEEAPV